MFRFKDKQGGGGHGTMDTTHGVVSTVENGGVVLSASRHAADGGVQKADNGTVGGNVAAIGSQGNQVVKLKGRYCP